MINVTRGINMRNYEVDFKHSTVGFSIKHMKLAKVKGTFDSYKASIYTNDIQNILTISINFETLGQIA